MKTRVTYMVVHRSGLRRAIVVRDWKMLMKHLKDGGTDMDDIRSIERGEEERYNGF